MKIYYTHSGYNQQRNFLNSEVVNPSIKYIQSYDIYKLITHFRYKLKGEIVALHLNSHRPIFNIFKKTYHFFNGVSHAKSPWITTFEFDLPRFGRNHPKQTLKAIKLLASPHCKKLIAISNHAKKWEENYLQTHFPDYAMQIISKIEVIHPPQKMNINDISEKKLTYTKDEKIVFTFIGNEFFRKGGREVLHIFSAIAKSNSNFELNIISNFSSDTYASNTTSSDVELLKTELKSLPSNIKILGSTPNDKVISLLKRSHVALLPTYADTYGYFVLEAQSCGCPVISTNIEAIQEINNNDCGWIVEVPKNEFGIGILKPETNRNLFREILETGLEKTVKEILNNPEQIKIKGAKALARIKEHHNPEKHAQRLLEIYQETQSNG